MMLVAFIGFGSMEAKAATKPNPLVQENAKLKKQNQALQAQVKKLTSQNQALQKNVKDLQAKAATIPQKDAKIKALEKTVSERDKEIKALEKQVKDLQGVPAPFPDNQYKVSDSSGLVFKGKVNVANPEDTTSMLEGIAYYELNMGEGYIIKVYVTDDYIRQYGTGFAYDELKPMIESMVKKRKVKPYTDMKSSLRLFFYTNDSGYPLSTKTQAYASYSSNKKGGIDTFVMSNGSNMPYDFRTTLQHELLHYFDFNSFLGDSHNNQTFRRYWGDDYRFWMIEGGAELSSYYFYNYPENTKNKLRKDIVGDSKEALIAYAKRQGGGKKNLLLDIDYSSFNELNKASGTNYGITLSLFWYLDKQYGYDKIYDYMRAVADRFGDKSAITQSEKDATAKEFFGKTEREILQDWLRYFNYFDGKLTTYQEIQTGTVNHVLNADSDLLPNDIKKDLSTYKEYNFLINIKEWDDNLDSTQMYPFIKGMSKKFKLSAPGHSDVIATYSGGFYTGRLTNAEHLNSYRFVISSSDVSKMVKGVEYTLEPINNDSTYKWIISNQMKLIYK